MRKIVSELNLCYTDSPGDYGSFVALLLLFVPLDCDFLRSRWVLISLDWAYLLISYKLLELILGSASLILSKLIL